MNKFSKEFIDLIKDNPDLPIYAYVDGEICCGDEFRWYLGEFGHSQLATILVSDDFERVYDDKEEFKEDYYDRHDDEFADLTNDEIEQTLTSICESQPWENCILVYIGWA